MGTLLRPKKKMLLTFDIKFGTFELAWQKNEFSMSSHQESSDQLIGPTGRNEWTRKNSTIYKCTTRWTRPRKHHPSCPLESFFIGMTSLFPIVRRCLLAPRARVPRGMFDHLHIFFDRSFAVHFSVPFHLPLQQASNYITSTVLF